MSVDMKVRKLILRCFQSGTSAKNTAAMVFEKFAIKGYAARTCQRWYRKFRNGDFDLTVKPTHNVSRAKKKAPQKEVKVEEVTFQQETRPQSARARPAPARPDVVQNLMQSKRDLTISRVKLPAISVRAASALMPKRSNQPVGKAPTVPNARQGTIRVKAASKLMSSRRSSLLRTDTSLLVPRGGTLSSQRRSAGPDGAQRRSVASNVASSRSQSRSRVTLNTDLRLPPSIAKRMTTSQVSTEKHTIGVSLKGAQKASETVKKPITVQFQNVSPEEVKNTVRKSTESGHSSSSGTRKSSTQSNPLAQPKGVIYLNPQQIFGEKLSFKTTAKKTSTPATPAASESQKRTSKTPTSDPSKKTPTVSPPALNADPPPMVTVDDSDSEDDVVFPAGVSIPPPKVKAVVNTFTTYWDMESDKPVLLNPISEETPSPPVIEVD